MNRKELADAIGISGAMVTKLARRGMPTDSIEGADVWRRENLEWTRAKGVRSDTLEDAPAAPRGVSGGRPGQRRAVLRHTFGGAPITDRWPPALDVFDWDSPGLPKRLAEHLGRLALRDFDAFAPELRVLLCFMTTTPEERRSVGLPAKVWGQLFPPGFIEAMCEPGRYNPKALEADGPIALSRAGLTPESVDVLIDVACGWRQWTP